MYEIRTLGVPPPIPTRQQVLQQAVTDALRAVGLESHPAGTWNVDPASFEQLVEGVLRIGNSLVPAYEYDYFKRLEVWAELRQRGYVTGEDRPPIPQPNGGPGAEDTLPPLQEPPPAFPLWLILLGLGVFAFAGRDNRRRRKSQGRAATLSAIPAEQYLPLSGDGCRDADGKFIPVPACTGKPPTEIVFRLMRPETQSPGGISEKTGIPLIHVRAALEKLEKAGRVKAHPTGPGAVLYSRIKVEKRKKKPKKPAKKPPKVKKAKVPQIRIVNPDEDLGKKAGYREFLLITAVKGEEGYHRILGKPVTIPGFEEATFFLHESLTPITGQKWRITEATTGFAVSPYGSPSHKAALEAVKQRLDVVTTKGFKKTIASTPKIWDRLPKAQVPEHLRLKVTKPVKAEKPKAKKPAKKPKMPKRITGKPLTKPMKRKKLKTFWIWKGTGARTTSVLKKESLVTDPEIDMPVDEIVESAKKGGGTLWMVTATDPMDAHHELQQAQREKDQRLIEKMDKNIYAVERSPEQWRITEAQRPTSLAKGLELKVGQDVEFQTPGGLRKTGTISTIIEGKVYVIPDGAQHSIPVKYISRIIPVRRKGSLAGLFSGQTPVLKGAFLSGAGCRDEDGKFIPTWQCTGRPKPKNVWDFVEKTPRQIIYKAEGHEGIVFGKVKQFTPRDQKHISEIFDDTREVLSKYRRIRNYYGFTKATLNRENLLNPQTNIVHNLVPFDRYFGMGSSGIDRPGVKLWWYSPKLSRQATEKLKQMVEATPASVIAHEVTHTIGSTRELIDPLSKAVALRFYLRHPNYVTDSWLGFEVETTLRQALGKAKPYNIEVVRAVYEVAPKYVDNILKKWLAPKDQERLKQAIR